MLYLAPFPKYSLQHVNVAIFGYSSCFLPPTDGFPLDDLRKILHGGHWMTRLQNRVEILSKISTGWVGWTNVQTDRRKTTERQTELRRQIPERNEVTFGYKLSVLMADPAPKKLIVTTLRFSAPVKRLFCSVGLTETACRNKLTIKMFENFRYRKIELCIRITQGIYLGTTVR